MTVLGRRRGRWIDPGSRATRPEAHLTARGRLAAGALLVVGVLALATDDATAQRSGGSRGRVYKTRLSPQWIEGTDAFWYRNDLAGGEREYVLVDAEAGTRELAFDHARLAGALSEALGEEVDARRLSIDAIAPGDEEGVLRLRIGGQRWRYVDASGGLEEVAPPERSADDSADDAAVGVPERSSRTGEEMALIFDNRTPGDVTIYWVDTRGERQSYGRVAAGAQREQHTFEGHVWEVRDVAGRTVAIVEADVTRPDVRITGREVRRAERRGRGRPPSAERGARRGRGGRGGLSPDGELEASVRDHDVYLRSTSSGEERRLTTDGEEGSAYGMLEWSPDSTALVAFRIRPGEDREVHLVESSPSDGGRARLHSRPYALPGDRFTSYELHLFAAVDGGERSVDVEPVDFGRPRLRWRSDGHTFTYEKVDRGHQRRRLIEVDAATGATRNIVDERAETFIWTAHTESAGMRAFTWLEGDEELIHVSEKDGWRHLYRVDVATGESRPITRGEYVVRGVDRIDEDERQIWFRASGGHEGQDPYFIHYYRVDFDGAGLVALTDGDGTHSIQYSPDRRWIVDTYSRVDMPPVHELRRVSDGALVVGLEEADASELEESGWRPPEVFSAKGRDGETDIWGIIVRPRDFDPDAEYPVIEDIYAGPHGSFVPKSFSSRTYYGSLTELGFIVVKIDGMGTANRSKAFHDVCWRSIRDGGFPDRIAWMRAAAEKHPQLDLDRVGIYGTSAGGQNAAAAVLFHPEFYKAAAAFCGCHDNRMDKASWNEQWMGYPVGEWYAESSNIDNAWRLEGRLLLMVGEMDRNVPPESTIRFADALIKSGKDFEFLLVPGAGHGNGGRYGQRRMEDFFRRHLLGVEPPNRNRPGS